MSEQIILNLALSEQDAWDLAQFLKRLCWRDIVGCAADQEEAYRMRDALEKLRKALADEGVAPR